MFPSPPRGPGGSPVVPQVIRKVLEDPSQYPDQLKSWLVKYLSGNKLLKIADVQLSSAARAVIAAGPTTVASVFGRVGAVVAQAGDYTAAQVTNAADKASASVQSFNGNLVAPAETLAGSVAGNPALDIEVSGDTNPRARITAGGVLSLGPGGAGALDTVLGRGAANTLQASNTGILSTSPSVGVGYGTGAGGAVAQITSRTTGVTLNKICGSITLVSAAGTAAWTTFTVTNSAVSANDVVAICCAAGSNNYLVLVTHVVNGSFNVSFATTGGVAIDTPVFNFAVIKAANS